MLAATLVAPGHNMVLPLMPEFIVKPDAAEKQDCERNAGKRWLIAHAERVKPLRPIFLGDDLFACQPICQAILNGGGDFLFTAKPDFFVTRAKSNVKARRVYSAQTDLSTGIICDQSIALTGQATRAHYPERLRRVRYKDAESGKTPVFLTNHFDLPALTIAALYKNRWQVELFFK